MILERNLSVILSILFSFFCLNLSQAQTSTPAAAPGALNQILSTVQATPPAQRASADSSGKLILGGGKYAEYQSICRVNEYDTTQYYSSELKKSRAELLSEKISTAGENAIKFKLKLLKEYIDQKEPSLIKPLIDSIKREKISSLDNSILNALVFFSNKNYSAARLTLSGLLNEKNDNLEVLPFLAEVYIKLENYYEASTIYEDLNKLTNNSYLIQLCETMVLNSVNADAETICQLAINKFPDNPFPHIYKGITFREREEFKKTMFAFQKSVTIKPTEMGYLCLAEAFYMKENFTEAADQFNNASNLAPKSVRAILGSAWTQFKLKNYDGALKTFKKACSVNGKYEMEIRKAARILNADKIPDGKKYVQAAEACGG